MASKSYLVLSALGPDRPGLVAGVTDYLVSRGGNVEDSRMAILGAEFGIMLLVSGTADAIALIVAEIDKVRASTGLAIVTRPTTSPEEHRHATTFPAVITGESLDHEGIVRAVATALDQIGVNIVTLESTAYNAPVTGSPLFRMKATVDVPRGLTLGALRTAMLEVARDHNIDVEVHSAFG